MEGYITAGSNGKCSVDPLSWPPTHIDRCGLGILYRVLELIRRDICWSNIIFETIQDYAIVGEHVVPGYVMVFKHMHTAKVSQHIPQQQMYNWILLVKTFLTSPHSWISNENSWRYSRWVSWTLAVANRSMNNSVSGLVTSICAICLVHIPSPPFWVHLHEFSLEIYECGLVRKVLISRIQLHIFCCGICCDTFAVCICLETMT